MGRSFLQKLSAGSVFYILDGKRGARNSKIVGKNHRQMVLKQTDSRMGKTINAIYFNVDNDLQENFDADCIQTTLEQEKNSSNCY